jgi:hypothetical protein
MLRRSGGAVNTTGGRRVGQSREWHVSVFAAQRVARTQPRASERSDALGRKIHHRRKASCRDARGREEGSRDLSGRVEVEACCPRASACGLGPCLGSAGPLGRVGRASGGGMEWAGWAAG